MIDRADGKTRMEVTDKEIQGMLSLIKDNLRGKVSRKVADVTLGSLLIKLDRANHRVTEKP